MSQPLNEHVLGCLDELRAVVKLVAHARRHDPAYEALDLGLAVCAGIAQDELSLAVVNRFVRRLCDALEAQGVEIAIGLVLPTPARLLYA